MNYYAKKKGIALIAATLLLVFALVLSAAFFMRSVSEKRLADIEKFTMQADFLAESGANHGLSELRKRIEVNLADKISTISTTSLISTYFTTNDSLGFLRQYAYQSPDPQFTVANGEATLSISALNAVTNIQGTYAGLIKITSAGAPQNLSPDAYRFSYKYTIAGTGSSTSITPHITKNISLSGTFTISVRRDNFAKFSLFTNQHTSPRGQPVWFTERTNFYGPVHTNDRFSFANNPSAHFTDEATQHLSKARYYNNGNDKLIDDDHNGVIDVPVFDTGFTRGTELVNLESSVTANDLKTQALGTMAEPGTQGIYIPVQGSDLSGGIYIRGDSSVALGVDGSNNPQYTIVQGTTTKIITVNYGANTTTVNTVGGSTDTYTGIPNGVANEGTIIYAKGDITSLSGTVQRNTNLTVSSERDIRITNHVRYQDYNAGNPPNAIGYSNMLGILSWGGDVEIDTTAPNNIEIHGVVMAPHGVFTVNNYDQGSTRGVATLLGGVITDYYGPFGTFSGSTQLTGYGRNFVYDERVLTGLTPPYFPYMANFAAYPDGLQNRPIWKRN